MVQRHSDIFVFAQALSLLLKPPRRDDIADLALPKQIEQQFFNAAKRVRLLIAKRGCDDPILLRMPIRQILGQRGM